MPGSGFVGFSVSHFTAAVAAFLVSYGGSAVIIYQAAPAFGASPVQIVSWFTSLARVCGGAFGHCAQRCGNGVYGGDVDKNPAAATLPPFCRTSPPAYGGGRRRYRGAVYRVDGGTGGHYRFRHPASQPQCRPAARSHAQSGAGYIASFCVGHDAAGHRQRVLGAASWASGLPFTAKNGVLGRILQTGTGFSVLTVLPNPARLHAPLRIRKPDSTPRTVIGTIKAV